MLKAVFISQQIIIYKILILINEQKKTIRIISEWFMYNKY